MIIAEHQIGNDLIRIIRLHPDQIEQRLEVVTLSQDIESVEPAFVLEGGTLLTAHEHELIYGDSSLPFGVDVVGDSSVEIVIREWSGGAHCCFQDHIISLGPQVRLIQSIDLGHSDTSEWERDQNGQWIVHAADWTFAYWEASFAGSAVARLVLAAQDGNFVPSQEHMKTEPVDVQSLDTLAREIRESMVEEPTRWKVRLGGAMLDLMYSGQREAAAMLMDWVLPADDSRRYSFETDFYGELSRSPWWPAVSQFDDPGIRSDRTG